MDRKQAELVIRNVEQGGEIVALRHDRGGYWLTRGQGDQKGAWVAPVVARSSRRVGTLVIDPSCPHLAEVDWQ